MSISVYLATHTQYISMYTHYAVAYMYAHSVRCIRAIEFLVEAKKFRRLKMNFLAHMHAGVHTVLAVFHVWWIQERCLVWTEETFRRRRGCRHYVGVVVAAVVVLSLSLPLTHFCVSASKWMCVRVCVQRNCKSTQPLLAWILCYYWVIIME